MKMDIAPDLLEWIRKDFLDYLGDAKVLEQTYAGAEEYAERVGSALAAAFQQNLSSDILPDGKMYWNIADRVVRPLLEEDFQLVSEAAQDVQKALNEAAGIGIRVQVAILDQGRVEGILNKICTVDRYDEVAWVLDEPIKTFSRSVVDDTLKANVDFQGKAGLIPRIIRRAESHCCEWCSQLEGSYEYPNVPKDIYRRHERCRCVVEYDPGSGKRKNVHTKQLKAVEDRDIIKLRQLTRLTTEDDSVICNIRENIIPKQNISRVTERQEIHRIGSQLYEDRKKQLAQRGQFGPSYVTISDEEILKLVKKYSGKGKIKYNRDGIWNSQETILTNDAIIGVVVDNRNGNSAETSVFKIHYGKDGIHIVPDYPSKKR